MRDKIRNLIKEEIKKQFINKFFNAKKLNSLPYYLYHLTDGSTIESVKKHGLLVKYSKQHKFAKGIYLADNLYTAHQYRFLDIDRKDYYVIEIPFKNLSTSHMFPDDYELFDLLIDDYYEYEDMLNAIGVESKDEVFDNMKHIWNELDFRHSLYISNQLIYTRDIPSRLFSDIIGKYDIEKRSK